MTGTTPCSAPTPNDLPAASSPLVGRCVHVRVDVFVVGRMCMCMSLTCLLLGVCVCVCFTSQHHAVTRWLGLQNALLMITKLSHLNRIGPTATDAGTLLVDGVLVSNYALYHDHQRMHLAMAPLRLLYTVSPDMAERYPTNQPTNQQSKGLNRHRSDQIRSDQIKFSRSLDIGERVDCAKK